MYIYIYIYIYIERERERVYMTLLNYLCIIFLLSNIILFHISGMGGLCLILSRTASESPPDLQTSQFKLCVMCILSVSLQTLSCTFGKDRQVT